MSQDQEESPNQPGTGAPIDPGCSLPERDQRHNSLVFIVNTSLLYFVAPVMYVGVLHATICKALGASNTVANLPVSIALWTSPIPLVITWLWPSPRLSQRLLVSAYGAVGAAGALVAVCFAAGPRASLIPILLVHATIIGGSVGVTTMCLWEMLGSGMSPARRGWSLGWAFCAGPMFALLGSFASQLVLSGSFLDLVSVTPIPKPWSYVLLFGISAPVMWLAAGMASLARFPEGSRRTPAAGITNLAGGIRQYFTNPLILVALFGFLLTYAGGSMIMPNLSVYASDVTGEPSENYAGLQLMLRFGFKSLFGLLFGWLAARTYSKAPLIATTATCVAGICWALLVPGKWYLLSFGLLGGGELFYVYYMNYIVACSAKERMRENTAYTNLISSSVGFTALIYGAIADAYGLRSSFVLALVFLLLAGMAVTRFLPRRPSAPGSASTS